MEKHSFVGKTREEAENLAKIELNDTLDHLYIKEKEIKSGGLFKSKKVEIEVIEQSEVIKFIKEYLIELITKMGLQANLEVKKREEMTNFILYADNNAILIGKHGRTIEAISILVKQVVYHEIGCYFPMTIDVSEYKANREKELERLAKRIAKEVMTTKIEVKMDSMNSYERRIIHNALTNYDEIYTESVGEEPQRCVVVKYKETK